MPVFPINQTNFTQGEISPWVYGRVDINQYKNSVRTLQNFHPRPQGGLIKRSGTSFIIPIKDETVSTTTLIEFIYSDSDTYVIEAGDHYFRFIRNHGLVISGSQFVNGNFSTDISSWTNASTGTGAIAWDAGSGGRMSITGGSSGTGIARQSVSFLGTAQYALNVTVASNPVSYRIGTTSGGTDIAAGTLVVGANSINFTPPTAGDVYFDFTNNANNLSYINNISLTTPVYEIKTPWAAADLKDLRYAQVFDAIYFVHPNYQPQKVVRINNAQWTIESVPFTDGPYFDLINKQYGGVGKDITITPSASTVGAATLTASDALFAPTDVGRLIRFRTVNTAPWGYAQITAYTSATAVSINIKKAFDGTGASKQWRLGAFSDTTGWPSTIAFHEQRMVLATTREQQQTLYFSVTSDIVNFQPDNADYKDQVDADSAMTYTIGDKKGNVIYWLVSLNRGLYIGASGGVWAAQASNQGEALTANNISIKPLIQDTLSDIDPLVFGSAVLFANKYKRCLNELAYSLESDSYNSSDLAILAEHQTLGNISRIDSQRYPNYLIWVKKEDGSTSTVTYLKDQNVIAWATQQIGGDDVEVESIICVPGDLEDETYFIVKRTINGTTHRYIEYLTQTFLDQDISDAVFLDSSLTYNGASTSTLSNLNHLEGQTVQCFGDGAAVVVKGPVTGGVIQLQQPVSRAVVGLPYDSIIETNSLESSNAPAQLQGVKGRVHKAVLRLHRSYGGYIGQDANTLDIIPEYSSLSIMNAPLTLKSGQSGYIIPSDFSYDPRLYILHNLPIPFTLLSVVYESSIGGS